MENMMITTTENREQQPFATFTKVIDGRTFAVRVFFPAENAEALQEKIERMLHRDIVNAIRQTLLDKNTYQAMAG